MRMMASLALAWLLGLAMAEAGLAQDAVLTITDGRQTVQMDQKKLGEMKQDVIETSVSWLDDDADSTWPKGVAKFSGPSFTDILNTAGMSGETIFAQASDGYEVEIPRSRLTADGAILATSANDQPLPADKAPFWIVFPYDQSPEMADEAHESWSVWAVQTLTVKAR